MSIGQFNPSSNFRPVSDINMTPLIDVMLVLLVIFMLTVPLLTSSVKINLPKANSGSSASGGGNEFIEITVDAKQIWYVDDQAITGPALQAKLESLAQTQPKTEIRLRVDQTVPYGSIASLMAKAQSLGLTRIGLITDSKIKPAAATKGVAK